LIDAAHVILHFRRYGVSGSPLFGIGAGFNFFSRAREGRDPGIRQRVFQRPVSIHAPVKGATFGTSKYGPNQWCFNPRAREGRDEKSVKQMQPKHVSIHAPAKGATAFLCFAVIFILFQSTRPRRARLPEDILIGISSSCFNPRAREGRDIIPYHGIVNSYVFQSTRPRRARLDVCRSKSCDAMFQSTRPRRARLTPGMIQIGILDVSIHAPAKGATPGSSKNCKYSLLFQSTRPRRARRRKALRNMTAPKGFNPRAREGRD